MKLSGRNALITGSSLGIGQGIALRFAEEGANIVVNYRSHGEEAEDTRRRIERMGRRCVVLQADVGKVDAARKLIEDSVAALGSIEILVNNAGIEKHAPFLEVPEDEYHAVIATNMTGPFFLTQAFARKLSERGRPGKVINISSVHEDLPMPNFTPYCMSKGGLRMMMRNIAIELAPLGITVNNIAPGAIETPINKKLLSDPKLLNPLLENIPLHRIGQPIDVAYLAAFLASDEAAYITGATMVVDGGLLWNYSEQ
jgi:glucose 1-dehydrogenase